MLDEQLVFLKLGGSLITDKHTPRAVRRGALARLAAEIAAVRRARPAMKLVLGHGSGSFGHVPAKKYRTRQGVDTPDGWRGFAEVWREAAALNRLVMDALAEAGIPALAFPPSAAVMARRGQVLAWDLRPLRAALAAGLLPVVYGDVVFDEILGGTILSTEDIFAYLAGELSPRRILLAGRDPGVWRDYPACTDLIAEITPQTWPNLLAAVRGSAATDVTGGMAGKVAAMLKLVENLAGLEVWIFGGEVPGNVARALQGDPEGTCLRAGRDAAII